jgi:hypothetical protein
MSPRGPFLCALGLLCLLPDAARAADFAEVVVDPPVVRLRGPAASWSLLVHGRTADGLLVDLTRTARYRSADPRIAAVSPAGVVRPVGDGETNIVVEAEGRTLTVAVRVAEAGAPRQVTFTADVLPVLTRFGCNSSGCHGKAEGQNGFKLSVFASDPGADFAALVKEGRGRRLFPSAPEQSLLLRKMSGQMAHGGGARIPRASADYETLRAWVAAGAPFTAPGEAAVVAVRVEPSERLLRPGALQQLRVVARYGDGREADVTAHAKFQSNNEALATVQPGGLVRAGDVPGDAAVMAGFMNAVDVFRVVVPRPGRPPDGPPPPENNFIDRLVFARLRKLNVPPSGLCDDATFLRRVFLDLVGVLPTPAEARAFLADPDPEKRGRLVDDLLKRPEFADLWALPWADLLRVDRQALGAKRAYAFHRWIRQALADGLPLDAFARAVVTAQGPLAECPPAAFYQVVKKPGEAASALSQVFLGVRIACAECHHHPFDRWDQADYHGLSAYFAGLAVRPTPRGEALFGEGPGAVKHPRSGADVFAHPLGAPTPPQATPGDRRAELAAWMTAPDNPWFARNLANRVWARLLGRGLVEPVDDFRATNPPTNPELLDALARHLIDSKYDLRALIRTITAARVYQLSAAPDAGNAGDGQNYSRALWKRPEAEVLLDLVCQATGVPERFPGMPPGSRAVQVWDSRTAHYFLTVFGRPARVTPCACERGVEPSVAQVLHLLNGPEIQAKLAHEAGGVARLVRQQADDAALVEELYLTFYSRPPTAQERAAAVAHLGKDPARRRQAAEDLAWSLLNSLEFLFNH